MQHAVTSDGGTAAQGLGSQESASTTTPPVSAHSWAPVSSQSGSPSPSTRAPVTLPGKQHTTSSSGGSSPQGFGMHVSRPNSIVPPSAAHSSGVSMSHSAPSESESSSEPWSESSSARQHTNAPDDESSSSARSPSRSSAPCSSRTTIDFPRGSTPSNVSAPFGCVLSLILPLPAALVVKLPTLMPPTSRSKEAFLASPRAATRKRPFDAVLRASVARPRASGAADVAVSVPLPCDFAPAHGGTTKASSAASTAPPAHTVARTFHITSSSGPTGYSAIVWPGSAECPCTRTEARSRIVRFARGNACGLRYESSLLRRTLALAPCSLKAHEARDEALPAEGPIPALWSAARQRRRTRERRLSTLPARRHPGIEAHLERQRQLVESAQIERARSAQLHLQQAGAGQAANHQTFDVWE